MTYWMVFYDTTQVNTKLVDNKNGEENQIKPTQTNLTESYNIPSQDRAWRIWMSLYRKMSSSCLPSDLVRMFTDVEATLVLQYFLRLSLLEWSGDIFWYICLVFSLVINYFQCELHIISHRTNIVWMYLIQTMMLIVR